MLAQVQVQMERREVWEHANSSAYQRSAYVHQPQPIAVPHFPTSQCTKKHSSYVQWFVHISTCLQKYAGPPTHKRTLLFVQINAFFMQPNQSVDV